MLKHIENDGYKIRFKWLDKHTEGELDYERQTLTINLPLFVVEVFLHEYIHFKYEKLSEREVIKKTNRKIMRMSAADIKKLAKKLLERG